jgi:hypothetical protein
MTVKINADTSDGLKFVSDTSGAIDFQSNGSTKVSLDSSGNLEVNNGNLTIDKSASPNLLFNIGGTEKGYIRQNANDLESNSGSGNVLFRTGGTERARIDSAGKLYAGSDTPWLVGSGGALAVSLGQGSFPLTVTNPSNVVAIFNRVTSTGTIIEIKYNANVVGSISTNGSATAYNTSSDYRLKENVTYTFDATTELKKLKPCKFNFKGTSETVEGFIAHEVSDVVPLAVNGTKDAVDDNGDAVYQGIDQSKLVPLLVKTIQELEARITALES